MNPTARRLLSTTASLAAKPRGRGAGSSSDFFDITSSLTSEFDFPLTRDTILKLEQRRTFLHYLRLEHLQFKDLVAFRQKYKPPPAAHFIQVRHQHYQGEEHPASRKVTIEFDVSKLPLTNPAAIHKFKLLAGPRFNPLTGKVKIGCELFPEAVMNEKWCSDTLEKLIETAKDSSDTMVDIPLDPRPILSRLKKTRAHKIVTLKDFPVEWLPKQQKQLNSPENNADKQALPSAGVGQQGGADIASNSENASTSSLSS